jgi:hypothetical protein
MLISEIKSKYSLDLDPVMSSSNAAADALNVTASPPTVVIIGASNASRLAALMQETGCEVHHIVTPSWMPNSKVVQDACSELEKFVFQESSPSAIIYFNLNSSAFCAVQIDGSTIPARQINGHYNLDGDLMVSTKEMYQKTLKICISLFQMYPNVQKIVLPPSPRYWLNRCCNNEEHIPNMSHLNYEDNLFDGLATLRRITKDYLYMQHIPHIHVVNPFLVFSDSSGRSVSPEAREAV